MLIPKTQTSHRQYLVQKAKPFVLQERTLYWFREDNKFHQILQPKYVPTMLQELHGRVVGGHFFFDIIMKKIMDVGYW
jgi:hypothetical protein